jgi:hypothetical protein
MPERKQRMTLSSHYDVLMAVVKGSQHTEDSSANDLKVQLNAESTIPIR